MERFPYFAIVAFENCDEPNIVQAVDETWASVLEAIEAANNIEKYEIISDIKGDLWVSLYKLDENDYWQVVTDFNLDGTIKKFDTVSWLLHDRISDQ